MSTRILGIAGSLRRGSFNRAALRAATQVVPADVSLEVAELDALPLFNQDHESPLPAPVETLKAAIRTADAVLLVTPEYNYSVSGVLKNAIDWASRPHGQSAWEAKPCAIMGASPGLLGTARAQYHLRQTCLSLNMFVLNQPEVMISRAAEKFDAQGELTDAKTREKIAQLLQALVTWTAQLRK